MYKYIEIYLLVLILQRNYVQMHLLLQELSLSMRINIDSYIRRFRLISNRIALKFNFCIFSFRNLNINLNDSFANRKFSYQFEIRVIFVATNH